MHRQILLDSRSWTSRGTVARSFEACVKTPLVTLLDVKFRRATLPTVLVVALWLGAAAVFATATSRVADWFVMTDELLYERLALSIDRLGTVVPHVHGETVANLNQLYPLILSIPFRHGQVAARPAPGARAERIRDDVRGPACIPAGATRDPPRLGVAGRGVATATVVWITLASFLLTEVAAYPAFLWALLAAHVCDRPSALTDLLAVAGIALAVLARTQFYVLAAVLAVAIVAQGLTERRLRATLRRHFVLCARLRRSASCRGRPERHGPSRARHVRPDREGKPAARSRSSARLRPIWLSSPLAGGLLPLLVGGGWLVANLLESESRERQAFAWLAVTRSSP